MLGAVIGGGLSGAFCLGLLILPANLAMDLIGGHKDYSMDRSTIAVGLLAMIFVGAFAGGAGAAVGKRRRH
jgi:hypothetical protein